MEIRCQDGAYRVRGKRVRCPSVAAPSLTVAQVQGLWEGRPVERVYAFGALTEGQRYLLFSPKCSCGENHRKGVANLMRVLRLDPQVLLRADEADLSLRLLIRLSRVCGDAQEGTLERQLEELRVLMFGGRVVDGEQSYDGAEVAEGAEEAA